MRGVTEAKIAPLLYYFKRQSNFSVRNCSIFLEDVFDKRRHNSGPWLSESRELCSAFPGACVELWHFAGQGQAGGLSGELQWGHLHRAGVGVPTRNTAQGRAGVQGRGP